MYPATSVLGILRMSLDDLFLYKWKIEININNPDLPIIAKNNKNC